MHRSATVVTAFVVLLHLAHARGAGAVTVQRLRPSPLLVGRTPGNYTLASPPDVGCMISERPGKPKRFSVNFGIPTTDARSSDPNVLTFVAVSIRNVSAGAVAPAITRPR